MEFEKFTAERYRSLDLEELEKRRDAILAALDGDEVEISVLDEERALCTAEFERRNKKAQMRSLTMSAVAGGAGRVIERSSEEEDDADGDMYSSAEYERAFMRYMRSADRSMLARIDQSALTTDVPVAIPTTMSNQIIEEVRNYDDILAMVNQTSFQGGIEIPIYDFDFTTKWVTEEEISDTQKFGVNDKISFSYHEFETRVQWSWLADIVTIEALKSRLQPKMSESIAKFLAQGIMRGTGNGQMKGIIGDDRITNVIEMTKEEFADWQKWHSIVDAAIKPEYEDGTIFMAKTTWNKYIDTMADDNRAPVNYAYDPVTGKRTQHLIGHNAKLVKADILPDFDTAAAGDVVAIYGDLKNYTVNWQPGGRISIMRYPDYDKRKHNLLGYGVCDGKVVDPYGFMLIKKKASA